MYVFFERKGQKQQQKVPERLSWWQGFFLAQCSCAIVSTGTQKLPTGNSLLRSFKEGEGGKKRGRGREEGKGRHIENTSQH